MCVCVCVCVSVLSFGELVDPFRLREEDMEQEAAETLKAQEPWRITDNELELYKAKVYIWNHTHTHTLTHSHTQSG